MTLNTTSSVNEIARAYDAYVDRCHDEYYADDYYTCPICEEQTLHVDGRRSGRGWWITKNCVNDECGYSFDDCEAY